MWGIIRRDAILFVSYRSQLVAQFLGPLFTITLFYYISRILASKTIHSPGGYFGFVIVGLVIVQILTISLGVMPVTVRQELVSGTIERFLVSAHGPVNGILGTMLFPKHPVGWASIDVERQDIEPPAHNATKLWARNGDSRVNRALSIQAHPRGTREGTRHLLQ